MITRPRPIYHTKCASQLPPSDIYRPPRIAVAADAMNIVVDIVRQFNAGTLSQDDLVFRLVTENGELLSYAYHEGKAYFSLKNQSVFTEKGLYKASIYLGEACLGIVEIVYAPAFAVLGAEVEESACMEGWDELADSPADCPEDDECQTEGCNTPACCEVVRENQHDNCDPVATTGYCK